MMSRGQIEEKEKRRSCAEFEFLRKIGEGSFGEVHEANDITFNRKVAIKIVNYQGSTQEIKNVNLLQEIVIPFVVKFYGSFVEDQKVYIIMDYCQNENLRSIIKKKKRENDETIKKWARQLMLVLVFMEEKYILHNDIKPENILLDAKRDILVVDIGAAQIANQSQSFSRQVGTGIYISPERNSNGPLLPVSDVWSCGIVFYELIYFKTPFETHYEFEQKKAVHHDQSKIGIFFKPIFEGIFVWSPEDRITSKRILADLETENPNGKKTLSDEELNLRAILNIITSNSEAKSKISNCVPATKIDNYIEIVDTKAIDKSLRLNNINITLLTAIGGAGKSTLAMQYAKEFSRKENTVVVWINADAQEKIDEKLKDILIYDLETKEDRFAKMSLQQKINSIINYVRSQSSQHLFVFDNIEEKEMETVKAFSDSVVPMNLKILLTARNKKVNKNTNLDINVIYLQGLSHEQAKKYLIDRISLKLDKDTIEDIFESVIKPLSDITPLHLKMVVEALDFHIENNGELNQEVKTQLNSLDSLDYLLKNLQNDENCNEVLNKVCFLDPDEISLKLLEILIISKEKLTKGIEMLEKYQIISAFFLNSTKFIKIHRLIIKWVDKLLKTEKEEYYSKREKLTKECLGTLIGIEKVTKQNMVKAKDVYRHLVKIQTNVTTNDDTNCVIELFEKLVIIEEKYYFNYSNAIKWGKKLVEYKKNHFACDQEKASIAQSLLNLANSNDNIGNYTEAIKLHKESLEMRRKCYKDQPDHPDIASSLLCLAISYEKTGNYSEAIKLHIESLEMKRKCYQDNPNHPNIASSIHNLAVSYQRVGNYAVAIELYKESLEINRKCYKDQLDHPVIATGLNNLATSYKSIGNYAEAIKLHKESLEMKKICYQGQPNHPEIAASLNNLAGSYKMIGNHAEAIKLYKESLEMIKVCYKDLPHHPHIAMSLNNLAEWYRITGNYAEAIKLHKESLDMKRKCYTDQPDHPAIAASLNNLASSYESVGNYAEAIKLHKESLEMDRKCHKDQPDHPAIATSLNNLALSYERIGNYAEAIKLHTESLEMKRKCYKDEPYHPDIASILCHLSSLMYMIGEKSDYLDQLEQIFLRYSQHSLNDSILPYVYLSLSLCNELSGNIHLSLDYSQKAVSFFNRLFENYQDSPVLARALISNSCSLCNSDAVDEALKIELDVLVRLRRAFKSSPDHPLIATALCNTGVSYFKQNNFQESLKYFKEALEMRQKVFVEFPQHPDIALNLHNLSCCYLKLKETKIANQLHNQAVEICSIVFKDFPGSYLLLHCQKLVETPLNQKVG